ncbi:MAG TPA: ATP-binding domain-containing protein, partial [Actinopolymorphaceae bacterium]
DLSPMQWRMLGRRGQRASWTIVGDPAQSSWPDAAEATRARDQALGKRTRRSFRLSTNYRNSAEIFEFARRVIGRESPDLEVPVAVRRTGVPPVHRIVGPDEMAGTVRGAVVDLLGAVEGTIGVVPPAARVTEVAGWAKGLDDRVLVLPPLATKGLEYDAVVVVEPQDIATENVVGVRTLYVVLTRATGRLVTVSTDDSWRD